MVKIIAVFLLATSSVLAQQATGNGDADLAIANAKAAAQRAKDVRDKAIDAATANYDKALIAIREDELSQLKPIEASVNQSGDTQAASAIQAAIDFVNKELTQSRPASVGPNNIAIVLYAGGSMVGGMDQFAKDQINKSVGDFGPAQSFELIVIQHDSRDGSECTKLFPSIVKASDENKKKMTDFLSHLSFFGTGVVSAGLQAAYALPDRPDAIFLMVNESKLDQDSKELEALRATVKSNLSPTDPMNILMICPKDGKPADPQFIAAVTKIANEAGGFLNQLPF